MSNEVKKVFFIVNRFSGAGFRGDLEKLIDDACRQHDVSRSIAYTEGPAHATVLARTAVDEGFSHIVAVGGDGTINEVAQSLLHTRAALGILPLGSGNGLARHLNIPIRTDLALHNLFSSRPVPMDSFDMNGRLSLNVSGIGFDGHIAAHFAREKRRGFQGYARLVMNEFKSFPQFEAQINASGRQINRSAFVIAIANSSQYGNNARIAPAASVFDELLDICILKKFPAYRLDLIYSFFSGTLSQSAYCDMLQAREISIRLSAPVPFHIDGEAAGVADTFRITVQPASLNVIAPSKLAPAQPAG